MEASCGRILVCVLLLLLLCVCIMVVLPVDSSNFFSVAVLIRALQVIQEDVNTDDLDL